MRDEGFEYDILRAYGQVREGNRFGRAHKAGSDDDEATTWITDPTAAINDLLAKARAKWPPTPEAHPWDSLDQRGLEDVYEQRGWDWVAEVWSGANADERYQVSWPYGPGSDPKGYGDTTPDALRNAMKSRAASARERATR